MTRMLNLSNTLELAVCQTALRSAAWQQFIAYLQAKDAGIKTVESRYQSSCQSSDFTDQVTGESDS
jgi:hypothetical protein